MMRSLHFTIGSMLFLGFIWIAYPVNLAAETTGSMNVTRAEAAFILFAKKNITVPKLTSEVQFADVEEGKWYTKYVIFATRLGMLGVDLDKGLVFPHRPVTRTEFLKMMSIVYDLPTDLPHSYADVSDDKWYEPYAGIASKHSLFFNKSNPSLLNPNGFLNHKQAMETINAIEYAYPEKKSSFITSANSTFIRSSTYLKQPSKEPDPIVEIVTTSEEDDEPQIEIVAIPKQERIEEPEIESNTVSMVKDAMVRLLQKNSLVGKSDQNEVIKMVNAERKKVGLPALIGNPILASAAESHAEDMFKRGYFSHFSPEGVNFVDRAIDAGYADPDPGACQCSDEFIIQWNEKMRLMKEDMNKMQTILLDECSCTPEFAVGENIAKGQLTSKQVMTDWMNSAPHKKNILRTEFEEIGVGIYGNLWVQKFGRIRYKGVTN